MKKKIQFIHPNYTPMFILDDDGVIEITRENGSKLYARCRYVDDYHLMIDNLTYHICEFSEFCERNHITVRPEPSSNLSKAVWSSNKYYVVLQKNDDKWDYSFYDLECRFCLGGYIDIPNLSVEEARDVALQIRFMSNDKNTYYASMHLEDFDQFMETTKEVEENRRKQRESMLDSFRRQPCDSMMILQMYYGHPQKFFGSTLMEKAGYKPMIEDYAAIYIKPIDHDDDVHITLEKIYQEFNLYHPKDFAGHSLSVSDVVLLKREGQIDAYMVDSIGFQKLDWF